MSNEASWTGPLQPDLDELLAFDGMRLFLERYWQARGKTDDDIAVLLGALNRSLCADGRPLDQAAWSDWKNALAAVRTAGGSAGLDPLSPMTSKVS
jgi:hypothetical protein